MTGTHNAFDRLLAVAMELTASRYGAPTTRLIEVGGYGESGESSKRALMRDLNALRDIGLQVDNRAPAGEEARYVITPGDTRLRAEFTAEQQAELQRVAAASGEVEIVYRQLPVDAEPVLRAVSARCLLRFTYNGRRRSVDPYSLDGSHRELLLVGRDRSGGQTKVFALIRMLDVSIGEPGTAVVPAEAPRTGTDPITWHLDEPVTAVLDVDPEYADEVRDALGGRVDGGRVVTAVTNRLVFLARLIELRTLARLESPADLRQKLRDHLVSVAGQP